MESDVFLRGVGAYVPDNVYTNDDLCEALKFPREKGVKYESLLGVKRRPICVDYRAGGRQIVSGEELAYRAACRALDVAGLEATELDAVIACSSFFDYIAPAVSSRLLKRLGLDEVVTFDLIGGCAEFLHGMDVAANMIRLGRAREVLVTSCEVINAWWRQVRYPIEHFIFGDTGGAVVLSSTAGSHRLRTTYLSTRSQIMGAPAELICVPILGGKEPPELYYDNAELDPIVARWSDIPPRLRLVHDIKAVGLGAPAAMVDATKRVLSDAQVSTDDVYLVPHQASIGVLAGLSGTGIPEARIGISLPERGNMSTSSVPVTLSEHWDEAMREPYLCLTSVGVGMSFGATLFERLGAPR